MANIVLTGDTSGSITVAAPAVAGTNTLTLPASTGTLATTADITGPIFVMTNSGSNQSVSNGVKTKVTLDTAVVDTNSAIDTANSKIVIPSGMGGIYSINYALRMDGNASSQLGIAIAYLQLNGSEYNRVYENQNSNLGRAFHCTRTTVLSLNEGDELELYGQASTSGGTQFFNFGITYTELSGHKIAT